MAVSPNIALSVKPIEIDNPLNQYARVAQLQSAQNQNALAQYQLGAAQRVEQSENALSQAYQNAFDPTTGKVDRNKLRQSLATGGFGSKIPTVEKALGEIETQQLTQDKTRTEIADAKLKQSRAFLDGIDPADPNAPARYLQWHQANHADPVLGPMLAARGVTAEQSMARIQQAIRQGPQAFAKLLNESKIGVEEFAKRNTMTAAESAADQRAREKLAQDERSVVYQTDDQGNVVALPSKLRAGEVPRARVAVAPGAGMTPLEGKPSEKVAAERLSINQQKATVQGAIDAVKNTPDAFGWATGNMPESVRARMATSDENEARAFVFNVVSGVIKERAGTAQSAGEAATLARFLPAEGDNATIIKDKLEGFQKYLDAKESGTSRHPKKETPAPSATGNSVTLPDGRVMTFPDANAASQFKKAAGL